MMTICVDTIQTSSSQVWYISILAAAYYTALSLLCLALARCYHPHNQQSKLGISVVPYCLGNTACWCKHVWALLLLVSCVRVH